MNKGISQPEAEAAVSPSLGGAAPQGVELRHLRYFVSVADAGTFTDAAERMFITQPTLSHQIRRLEKLVGTPLFQRRRDGIRLTTAGIVLLEESRTLLSLFDHGVSRTRQAAGLGQPRLRVVLPPHLPELLAVETASRLLAASAAAAVDIVWMETALDAEFSLIRQHRADAGLGWLISGCDALPPSLDVMSLGEFEPEVWIPSSHDSALHGTISTGELLHMPVIHGPRRADPAIYAAWLTVLRAEDAHFEFADPPFRNSLPRTLAFAATGTRPAAVLTGPRHAVGTEPRLGQFDCPAETYGMVPVRVQQHPLVATAGLAWSLDLPRPLQQVLFDTADSVAV
jgi:DNA-binding transcriptional LysR family regulator